MPKKVWLSILLVTILTIWLSFGSAIGQEVNADDSFIAINSTNTTPSFYAIGMSNVTSSLSLIHWLSLLPGEPTNFTITQTGTNSINITWTKGVDANTTVIRVSTNRYPRTVTDGYSAYNSDGTYVEIDGLTLDSVIYYYRAWSYNEYGYSIFYAQANTGGTAMVILGLLFISFFQR